MCSPDTLQKALAQLGLRRFLRARENLFFARERRSAPASHDAGAFLVSFGANRA
jgi:hypothetical protein